MLDATPVTLAEVARWQSPFTRLIDTVDRRTREAWSGPTPWSNASLEIESTSSLQRVNGDIWGEYPLRTVCTVANMLVVTIAQHAHAVSIILSSSPRSILAIDTLTRAALETAAQAAWLTDSSISGRQRVARCYVLRRKSAEALQSTAADMGMTATADLGALPTDLDSHYLTELQLATVRFSKKGGILECEGESLPNYTDRVAGFIRTAGHSPEKGPYAYFCGASHSQFWRIAQGYQLLDEQAERFTPITTGDSVRNAVSMCIDGLVYPAIQLFKYLGRGAALSDLRQLESDIHQAFKI